MDNFFIADELLAGKRHSSLVKFINKGLQLIRSGHHVQSLPNTSVDMTTIEQRINYFHLLDAVIANGVQGEVIELGCFTGQCALLFQRVIEMHGSEARLHLYDSFESKFTIGGSVEDVLNNNFIQAGLRPPILHKGYFEKTIPGELPPHISFVHIDCGFGGDHLLHSKVVRHCLQSVYPRMSKGAVCVLMDYHKDVACNKSYNVNPGVRLAVDDFLAAKPEKIVSLYGNQYAHGFFRKS